MKWFVGCILFVSSFTAFSQTGNYRSLGSGPWSTAGTWERDANSDGTFEESPSATAPNNLAGTILIRNTHVVTVTAGVTIDQVTVESGGTLTVNAATTLTLGTTNGTGDDLVISAGGAVNNNGIIQTGAGLAGSNNRFRITGTLNNNGTILNASATKVLFNVNSVYNHLHDQLALNTIPSASWNANSTVNITGRAAGAFGFEPAGLNQSFGNFVWNCPNQDDFLDLLGAPVSIQGTFRVDDTGAGAIYWNQGGGVNTTFNVGDDFIVNNGLMGFVGQFSGGIMNVTGDVIINGGTFQIAEDEDATLNIAGDLQIAGGTLDMVSFGGTAIINLLGNYSITSGDLAISNGTGNIDFEGNTTQTFVSATLQTGNVNFTIANNAILQVAASSFIGGGGALTVDGTLSVASTHASGAIQTGASNGNVRVTGTRTYNSGSTIEYSGTAAQIIGNGHPTSGLVNTIINNTSVTGVSLFTGTSLNTNNLTLTDGDLNVGSSTLTINGNLLASSTITIGAAGSIVINGSGTIGTFPFPAGNISLTNFTLNHTTGVTFNNTVTISGLLTLTNGVLAFPGRTLSLGGTMSPAGSGTLAPSSTSVLALTGSGAFGTLRIDPSNNTVGTLTMSRSSSGSAALNSTLIVANTFNLSNGVFTNTNGLQMANGSMINRGSNASLAGSAPTDLPANENYNVSYTGSAFATGLELPGIADDPTKLGSLTINGGTITLDKSIRINGSINLQSSTLDANGFDITFSSTSAMWNKTGGSFIGGSGTVRVTGNLTITYTSTPPSYTNITTTSGSTLTFPNAAFIAGNLNLNATSTFNNGNGLVTFNGSGDQTLTATGKTFNNITINKTGGQFNILPSLNLTGLMSVLSATTIQSNGNLTLISTSDGTSGNGAIGALPTGASVVGSVTVQRRMSGEGRVYRDISSPVQTATVQQIMNSGITVTGFSGSSFPCAGCATNNPSMYRYNESVAGALTNGYVAVASAGEQLTPGLGYNVLVRNELGARTMSLSGSINSGTFNYNSVPLISFTNSANAGDGWNFIGNPYPSSIDWDNGWTVKQNIQGNMISIWDAGANQYRTWNGAIGSLSDGLIATGQGFWFQASGATPQLTVTESAKSSSTASFLRKKEKELHYLELAFKGNGTDDKTFLQIVEGASMEFDGMDGSKLAFEGFSLSTLAAGDRKLAINAIGEIPLEGRIQLDLSNAKVGAYEVFASVKGAFEGVNVSLLDQYTNDIYPLDGSAITVNITDDILSQKSDRFILVFGEQIVTDVEESSSSLYTVFPNPVLNDMSAYVKSKIQPSGHVIDNVGKVVGKVYWNEKDKEYWHGELNMSNAPSGIYYLSVKAENGVKVLKFIKD